MKELSSSLRQKRRPKRLLIAVVCLVAIGFALARSLSAFRREPMHNGHAISYWVDRACAGFDGNNVWSDRMEVKNIGPVAVPYLVGQLQTTDRWRTAWNSWRTHLPASWQRRFRSPELR